MTLHTSKSIRPMWLAALALAVFSTVGSRADHAPRTVAADALVDLRTSAGLAHLQAQWRYRDTRIQEIQHRSVGPDLKATGPANHTFDFTPDARATDFDDHDWEVIPADSLENRRGHGRLSLNWYRLQVTLPEKVADFRVKGATAVFEIVVDDYAEVWVNGKASYVLGQSRDPDPRRPARRHVPDRRPRHQRSHLDSSRHLHLGAQRDARVLRPRQTEQSARGEARGRPDRPGAR
jgi:hypothetical protein